MYGYAVSVNVAIPTSRSKGDDLIADLKTLIKYCGFSGNPMRTDESFDEPAERKWDRRVELTANLFKEVYDFRNFITHGMERDLGNITDETVKDAHELAHNAVRSVAMLAREFNWQAYKDGKRWFQNPSFPPSVRLRNRVNELEHDIAQFSQTHERECRDAEQRLEELQDSFAHENPTKKDVLDSLVRLRLACNKLPIYSSALHLTTEIEVIVEDLASLHGHLISMPIPRRA